MPNFIFKSKAPISLVGAAKAMCQTPLFSAKTLTISSIQATTMFRLAATLCENGGTSKVMVSLEDTFVPPTIPHPVYEANYMEVSKVQLGSWHVAMAKLHDHPSWPAIDQASGFPRVVVVHNEEGMVQLKGALACRYWPLKLLLDFSAQTLMLGKAIVDGLGLTNADLNQCPYHVLTSMGGLKKAQRLTK